jgi:hypothetical protein
MNPALRPDYLDAFIKIAQFICGGAPHHGWPSSYGAGIGGCTKTVMSRKSAPRGRR